MPKKYTGFSYDEHKKKGEDLYQARMTLHRLYLDLTKAYGKTSDLAKLSNTALKSVEELRNQLDNLVCRENPKCSDMDVNSCYYGQRNAE